MIASYLHARDAESYARAKRDLYEKTYKRQLVEEKRRMREEQDRKYEEHIRNQIADLGLDRQVLEEVVRQQVHSAGGRPPPVPRPPSVARRIGPGSSEHRAQYVDPRLRKAQINDEAMMTSAQQQGILKPHSLVSDQYLDYDNQMRASKRVAFRSRPQSACDARSRCTPRRGGHFFVWRDAEERRNANVDDVTQQFNLWRVSKYRDVKPKVDNRWTAGALQRKVRDDGKVDVKVECPAGEEVNVNLRVDASPSRTGYIRL